MLSILIAANMIASARYITEISYDTVEPPSVHRPLEVNYSFSDDVDVLYSSKSCNLGEPGYEHRLVDADPPNDEIVTFIWCNGEPNRISAPDKYMRKIVGAQIAPGRFVSKAGKEFDFPITPFVDQIVLASHTTGPLITYWAQKRSGIAPSRAAVAAKLRNEAERVRLSTLLARAGLKAFLQYPKIQSTLRLGGGIVGDTNVVFNSMFERIEYGFQVQDSPQCSATSSTMTCAYELIVVRTYSVAGISAPATGLSFRRRDTFNIVNGELQSPGLHAEMVRFAAAEDDRNMKVVSRTSGQPSNPDKARNCVIPGYMASGDTASAAAAAVGGGC